MAADSTANRFRAHAGLDGPSAAAVTVSLATRDPVSAQDLSAALSDFIDAGADREACAVDTGWLAVLAGDIDDVRQHIAEEEAAREP